MDAGSLVTGLNVGSQYAQSVAHGTLLAGWSQGGYDRMAPESIVTSTSLFTRSFVRL